ncbi:MAG: ATP-binding protein [Deltaproteobacteria bacterium]|nr:ATP-binding protein [Deltaproteobacteria bacterium]
MADEIKNAGIDLLRENSRLKRQVRSLESLLQRTKAVLDARNSVNDFLASQQEEMERNMRLLHAERKAAEMANQAKSNFLAMMSHEIRTPMNSIMGFAELALHKAVEPQIKDYSGKIADSTRWLLRIIDNILDISKIESGKMELERAPFDLNDVFSRCKSVILPSVKAKNIDLRVYLEPPGKKLVGDSVRLNQVLMNLLSNAVKFTRGGTVKFSSMVKGSDEAQATIYFEIRDNGIGMGPEELKKIFEPFVQADPSTTRNYGGTGLGLAITKNLVELMGGELRVESSPGLGSAFSFEIVFETMDASGDAPDHVKIEAPEKPRFEGLILVCDDNSMNQELMREHLARVGLRTAQAENGEAGLEMVQERLRNKKKPFDLIFMDMFMPVMDGMEAASKITALETGTPIVAMTANVMAGELEKYRQHGMPDCLGKPFTSRDLWRVLLKYLPPVNSRNIDEEGPVSEELQKRLRVSFAKKNQAIHIEIAEAAAAGDIKLAHRLAHTLKGNAGLIGKTGLQSAAEEVEELLKEGGAISVWGDKMKLLKSELTLVLEELRPLLDESGKGLEPLTAERILALFDKLEPLLENISPHCLGLIDEIRAVPGAEELARLIEDYDFAAAAEALAELRGRLHCQGQTD